MKITVAIISNSEKIDQRILKAVDFASEILIIVDSKIRKPQTRGKIHLYFHPLENNFAKQRNFALTKAQNDWVLFVDNDEYVGTELAVEIQSLKNEPHWSGFFLHRLDVCFHQPLTHGETGNTKLLRLANRKKGKFSRCVHETWRVSGQVGELSSPLYHLKDNLVSGFIDRMAKYSKLDANALLIEDKPFTLGRLFFNPPGKFIQNYFFKQGIRDGLAGLISAYLMSVQSLTVRIFQWTKIN